MNKQAELAWKILVELRQEVLSSQRIRSQIVGFKITFVSTAIALIVANLKTVGTDLLVIPAFAAVFFDLLINSYSVGIKRIGYYCQHYLEPKLRKESGWPQDEPLWQEFMSSPHRKQNLSFVGNIGITTLAFLPAVIVLFHPFRPVLSVPLLGTLLGLFVYDLLTYLQPRKITEGRWRGSKTMGSE